MRDDELAAKIAAGDHAALATAYDTYAPGLYSYCQTMTDEPGAAVSAVQDTFVVAAQCLGGLRDGLKLCPWLYAVARNECLRRLHGREAAGPPVAERPGEGDAFAQAGHAALVCDALRGTSPAARSVLSLRLHDLDADEQALVLGISRSQLSAFASRAAAELNACLGVLLVARGGREDCPELDAMLAGWDGRLTPKLRRQLTRHLEHCAACTVRRHQELTPEILDQAAGPLAAATLPAVLRRQVIDAATSDDPIALLHRAAAAKRAGPFSRHSGFPPRLATPHWHKRRGARVGAAGAAVGAGVAAAAVLAGGGTHLPHAAPGLPIVNPVPASGNARPSGLPGRIGKHGGGPGTQAPAATATAGTATATAGTAKSATATAKPGTATATGGASPLAVQPSPAGTSSPPPGQATAGGGQGTVSVSPSTLTLTPLTGSTFTVTAQRGPVSWSVSDPASLVGTVTVSPSAGTLAAGQSVTVTVTAASLLTVASQLTVSPGGETVTILAGLSL